MSSSSGLPQAKRWPSRSRRARRGYLLFVAVTTTYIVVGILLEERDLVDPYCDEYRRYKDRVSMLVPWRKSA